MHLIICILILVCIFFSIFFYYLYFYFNLYFYLYMRAPVTCLDILETNQLSAIFWTSWSAKSLQTNSLCSFIPLDMTTKVANRKTKMTRQLRKNRDVRGSLSNLIAIRVGFKEILPHHLLSEKKQPIKIKCIMYTSTQATNLRKC